MPSIVNIAAYRFADLSDLGQLRSDLHTLCGEQQLKGTILIAPEGINLFVAGSKVGTEALLSHLQSIPAIGQLDVKESLSDEQPFNRMLVKIKCEIIAFGVEGIDPRQATSPRISPRDLKRWLDESRPVTLLDARNDFEVEAGTFTGATAIGIDHFRDFPAAVHELPEELKQQPVVTFCTGGIRCEKAAPLLEREGFAEVYQLDGGILKYFEQCGGEHFEGECFVFDKRVAVDPQLRESKLTMCFACQAILSPAEQASPLFVEGECCPHCHQDEARSAEELLALRHAAIGHATDPLPGSQPYDNVRPIRVPQRHDGQPLLEFFDAIHTQLSRDQWEEVCRQGQLHCEGQSIGPDHIVRAGQRLLHQMPATREPDVNGAIEVLHEDEALVVVNKPAPLPIHPCGRFNRNTLSYVLNHVYKPLRLRPAHRLDADTSGVVVLCKSRAIAAQLHQQFAAGEVRKFYLARVHGSPLQANFTCDLAISDKPGPGGIRLPDADGQPARTQFKVQHEAADGTALLTAQPLTGRTNQIRVHLWAMNIPIVGDAIYLRDYQLGTAAANPPDAPPLQLHSASMELKHPLAGEAVTYNAPSPTWAAE